MSAVTQRPVTILRQRLASDVVGLPIVWALFAAGVMLVVSAVLLLGPDRIDTSAWEQAAQLARWYAGGLGVYLTAVYLPLYIAHGFTRREYATQLPAFTAVFAAGFAALMTLGYAVETVVYRTLGWSQRLSDIHLFATPTDYPLVLLEFFVLGAVWTVAGAVLGAAFYRRAALGLVLVPVALLSIALVEAVAGPRYFGPFPVPGAIDLLPLVSAAAAPGSPIATVQVAAGVLVLGLVLLWALVRNLPVRSKAA